MRTYIKVCIISLIFSISYIFVFNFFDKMNTITYYVYQVGIYKEESNKDKKMNEIENQGLKAYFYKKNNQFYVLSLITTDKNLILKHSNKYKGIIKEYVVNNMDIPSLIKSLEDNDV